MASCSLQPVMMRYMRPNHSYGRTLTIGIHWCVPVQSYSSYHSITYARPRTSFRSIWTRLQRFACNDFASKSLLWLIMFDIESSLRELYITAGGNNEKFEG